jgi:hypothetical protein
MSGASTPLRGLDSTWRTPSSGLERRADPSRTVFVVHDFDWVMTTARCYWGVEEPASTAGPAPQAHPKFKWIGFDRPGAAAPGLDRRATDSRPSAGRSIAPWTRLRRAGGAALETSTRPNSSAESGMIADSRQLAALHALLRRDFVAEPAFDGPVMGRFDRLRRAPAARARLVQPLAWTATRRCWMRRSSRPTERAVSTIAAQVRRAAARPRPGAGGACAPRARPAPGSRRRRAGRELFTKATYLATSFGKKPSGSNTLGST